MESFRPFSSTLEALGDGSGNRIENKNVLFAALIFLSKKRSRPAALRFIRTVQRDFFIPQFQGRFKIRRRPVVWVDHPLDEKIPFMPHHVAIYLSFTHFWIKSIYFLYREFGRRALPSIVQFMNKLDELYRESALVYRRVQSTTNRPHHYGGFYFKVIHLFDPHLHCIPSLHVGVVGLTYRVLTELIDRFADDPEAYAAEKEYLWRRAVLITESILFIKQHSVNCIAAGLYTLSAPCYGCSKEMSYRIIDALFTGEGNRLEDSEELREYIRKLYDHFMEAAPGPDNENPDDESPSGELTKKKARARVLIDFLMRYEEYLELWQEKQRLPDLRQ